MGEGFGLPCALDAGFPTALMVDGLPLVILWTAEREEKEVGSTALLMRARMRKGIHIPSSLNSDRQRPRLEPILGRTPFNCVPISASSFTPLLCPTRAPGQDPEPNQDLPRRAHPLLGIDPWMVDGNPYLLVPNLKPLKIYYERAEVRTSD